MLGLKFRTILLSVAGFAGLVSVATASVPINVPMSAERWSTKGDVKFKRTEGFPNGLMENKGGAVLNGLVFSDGTIDVDVIFGGSISTLTFRRGDDHGEALVLRPQPNCPASNDCIQYTPVIHGAFMWDLFPQYEVKAPLSEKGWNHLRIVAAGRRMNVYVNGLSEPALSVTRLEGEPSAGAIRLSGPATWANLVITPNDTGSLKKTPSPDPSANDNRYVRAWSVSAAQPTPTTVDKKLDAQLGVLPVVDASSQLLANQRPLSAEANGLVNLSRAIGSQQGAAVTGAWLSTSINSDRDQIKHVSLGWAREIVVFMNGKQVFADRNIYGAPTLQKQPDGRVGLENGQFGLPLHKGRNEMHVFIDDNFGGPQHFGWGFKMRLDDLVGVQLGA